jgi:lysozyme
MTDDGIARTKGMITRHEGMRLSPYKDSVGKLTIGVGHNLDDVPITENAALAILGDDVARVVLQVKGALSFFDSLTEPRQAVLLDMAFNMGLGGLLQFHHFLANLQDGQYGLASQDMLNSEWARQVGQRATELAKMMQSGAWS